jgi:hypothetical protein
VAEFGEEGDLVFGVGPGLEWEVKCALVLGGVVVVVVGEVAAVDWNDGGSFAENLRP